MINRFEDKIEEIMQRGGVGFWILCTIFAVGFYGLLWFSMALGVAFNL
jgi:hypothetical protein